MRTLLICLCLLMSGRIVVADTSIYRMMIGGRILELAGTSQLTNPANGEVTSANISPNGKYVVYLRKHLGDTEACLLRTSLGRPIVIMSPPPNRDDEGFTGEIWTPYGGWSWSPDSAKFTLFASHSQLLMGQRKREYALVVFSLAGSRLATFLIEDKADPYWPVLQWSPDGRRFAGAFHPSGVDEASSLRVFDVSTGSADKFLSTETEGIALVSWGSDGRSLQYMIPGDRGKGQLRELNLSTNEDKVIKEDYCPPRMPSPDGVFELSQGPVISIGSSKAVEPIRIGLGEALGWAPNSKILAYQKPIVIKDESGRREQDFDMLWLAAAEANPFNHMCAALDSQKSQPPTWSNDCLKMAYISDGNLFLAEFAWKPITPYDKLDAGLPLTEMEEQSVLVDKAREIGKTIDMYHDDWDGKYPSGDNFGQELDPYTRDNTLFFRPGTEKVAFQYFPPSGQIAFPATTMMGTFDVGYAWKVVLYADGHVQIVAK